MSNRGILFVMSAPAGTGKTTLIRRLVEEMPDVVESVSFTSRAPRPNEVEGVDYFFLTREEFKKRIKEGEFLEHVELYDDYYGTSEKWVEKRLQSGKSVFLVIDTQGAMNLREKVDTVFIFVAPPSLEELRRRIEGRKTESEEVIEKRLNWAKKELEVKDQYDYQIINDDLEQAFQELKRVVGKQIEKRL